MQSHPFHPSTTYSPNFGHVVNQFPRVPQFPPGAGPPWNSPQPSYGDELAPYGIACPAADGYPPRSTWAGTTSVVIYAFPKGFALGQRSERLYPHAGWSTGRMQPCSPTLSGAGPRFANCGFAPQTAIPCGQPGAPGFGHGCFGASGQFATAAPTQPVPGVRPPPGFPTLEVPLTLTLGTLTPRRLRFSQTQWWVVLQATSGHLQCPPVLVALLTSLRRHRPVLETIQARPYAPLFQWLSVLVRDHVTTRVADVAADGGLILPWRRTWWLAMGLRRGAFPGLVLHPRRLLGEAGADAHPWRGRRPLWCRELSRVLVLPYPKCRQELLPEIPMLPVNLLPL